MAEVTLASARDFETGGLLDPMRLTGRYPLLTGQFLPLLVGRFGWVPAARRSLFIARQVSECKANVKCPPVLLNRTAEPIQ